MTEDYILTARAKGLFCSCKELVLDLLHECRNPLQVFKLVVILRSGY